MMVESKVFTPDLDAKLIFYVRDNPILYDCSDSSYKNSLVKDDVWRMISADLDKTVDECKMRWRTIRDSYKKNLRKMNATNKSGLTSLPKSKYTNKNLQFLDRTFKDLTSVRKPKWQEQPASSSGSDKHSSYLEAAVSGSDEEEEVLFCEKEILEVNISSEPEQCDGPDEKLQRLSSAELGRHRGGKRKVSSRGTPSSAPAVPTEHPLDIFFRSMAETVKTFPQHLLAETRMKICQVVTEMEIKAIQGRDKSCEDLT